MISHQNLNAFLWYGYLPRASTRYLDPIIQDEAYCYSLKGYLSKIGLEKTVRQGDQILRKVFKNQLLLAQGLQIVPLSGGLDSRLILAHLIDAGLQEQIIAVTYGTPGTLDYEIPKLVAKHLKVKHELFDLTKLKIEESDLKFAYVSGATWVELITAYYNHMLKNNFGSQPVTYWSGFLGGEIAGSHYLPGHESLSWNQARQVFVNYNKCNRKENKSLCDTKFLPDSSLPQTPFIDNNNIISYPEQLDLAIRQSAWINKAVVGNFNNVLTPFTDPDWVRFMLCAPLFLRSGCKLYHQIMLYQFSKLFSIKTKSVPSRYLVTNLNWKILNVYKKIQKKTAIALGYFHAKTTKNLNSSINYIDFVQAYREREDFIALAETAINQLEKFGIIDWFDPYSILERHIQGTEDLSQEIQLLTSLAYNLKFQEQNCMGIDT